MFWHIFISKLKEISRMKFSIGWNLVFPILLATAFNFGFGNAIRGTEKVSTVFLAVVEEGQDSNFVTMLDEISKNNEGLLDIKKVADYDEALKLLQDEEVDGIYIVDGEDIRLEVTESDIHSTVLSSILKSYINYRGLFEDIIEDETHKLMAGEISQEEYEAKIEELSSRLTEDSEIITSYTFKENPVSQYMSFFFSLVAMACLYGSWLSSDIINGITPTGSEQGKRLGVSPVAKSKIIIASSLAALVVQGICNLLLVLYIQYVLGFTFGTDLLHVLIPVFIASLSGITSGILIGAIFAGKPGLATGVSLAYSMLCSFLSGLMVSSMKAILERNLPFVNKINPAALLNNALYTAGTYGIISEYYLSIIILLVEVVVFVVISAILLRKGDYKHV